MLRPEQTASLAIGLARLAMELQVPIVIVALMDFIYTMDSAGTFVLKEHFLIKTVFSARAVTQIVGFVLEPL